MKFPTHPSLVKLAMLALSGWLRALHATMDMKIHVPSPETDPRRADRPTIFAFWHEMLMFPAYSHARLATVMVSNHRDGEFIAQVVRMMRGRSVRGSTRRGGAAAARQMLRLAGLDHLAITPDGPRGPRRTAQPGVIYLASRSGMPIVPVGFAYSHARRANSWDRMAVPWPFCRARSVSGQPIHVPPRLRRDDLADWAGRLERALNQAQQRAELLARTGQSAPDMLSGHRFRAVL